MPTLGLGAGLLDTPRDLTVYDASASALFARFTTPPTSRRKSLINTLIAALKTGGVWSRLDALYLMAAADAQAAQRNWIKDSFNLAPASSPVFTADSKYATNGTTNYLDTGLAATTATQMTQNAGTVALWSKISAQRGASAFGSGVGATTLLDPRNTSDLIVARVNQATFTTRASSTDGSGLFAATRRGAALVDVYRNGAIQGATSTESSTSPTAETFCFGKTNTSTFCAMDFAAGFIGADLTAAQHLAAYNAISAYLTAIGAI